MKKFLKYFFLLLPLVAFAFATAEVIILNVLPAKYLAVIIAIEVFILIVLTVLLSRRHKAPVIISALLCLLSAAAAGVASYYLVVTNSAIANITQQSVVTSAETGDANITNTPFILLINGIDNDSADLANTIGNCDVNQMLVVNPVSHQVLIVNTPRDYYVFLHDRPEMRDKLTHAGYYDLETSRLTLEELYDINIDYYVRINFATVTQLIDLIGGVDIESEWEFNTTNHTHVKKGWNHFDGKQALAYARERKYFGTGDIQRASDQQQVMIAIFEKLVKSPELLTNFAGILNTLSGSFITDLPIDQAKELAKIQLERSPEWHIETTAVSGTAMMTTEVASLAPTQKYYVVVPDEDSIAEVREKIEGILEF